MKYIRTKDGYIFEIVDYEQLDENTKKNVRQPRYVGLEDYLNEKIFVKIYKNMPHPISQYQSIKMFDILKQADTIEELCDVLVIKTKDYRGFKGQIRVIDLRLAEGGADALHNYIVAQMTCGSFEFAFLGIETDKGLIYVAKMNDKGELELL